ncbi:MAG: Protein yceI precursor [uncultured Thiotrichaceae bacterium]|uniref:Protein yceI n=1 Tax=uncultured Thiotrichaceae bacterium TaxID=298394 RepID=A0A6S6U1L1_9GAMM|nr:MAG: Protein yceI precursor [uncultured Thiotrichaceae bacterium]
MKMKTVALSLLLASGLSASQWALADDYKLDIKGMHSFVQFRIQHLGYSWLYGRFNDFDGQFSYDENAPEKAAVNVSIKTTSVDSNHAERDKHLRGEDFLNVDEFPEATFKSTAYKPGSDGKATLEGDLTLHGVTKPVTLAVEEVGAGKDPWGGFRRGFIGTTTFALADFGIDYNLGPASKEVELTLSVEGIKQ